MNFRAEVGRVILIGAIAYCGLLTLILAVGTYCHCEVSQPIRDIIIIILTWFTTKAGTVVDHQFGSSQGSEDKTNFLMKGVASKGTQKEAPEYDRPGPEMTQ
jgi:hypothetical protein